MPCRPTRRPEITTPCNCKIQYYALMREQAGRSDETVETAAATPADLYAELRRATDSRSRASN